MRKKFTLNISTKPKRSLKTKTKARVSTWPFKPSILREAKKFAGEYHIILERNDELGFIGTSIELPTVFSDGKTPDKCYKSTQQALTVAAATMIESGQKPPQSSSTKKRTAQVNIRLSAEEKLLLSNSATNSGFKGLSDFIRDAALRRIYSDG